MICALATFVSVHAGHSAHCAVQCAAQASVHSIPFVHAGHIANCAVQCAAQVSVHSIPSVHAENSAHCAVQCAAQASVRSIPSVYAGHSGDCAVQCASPAGGHRGSVHIPGSGYAGAECKHCCTGCHADCRTCAVIAAPGLRYARAGATRVPDREHAHAPRMHLAESTCRCRARA